MKLLSRLIILIIIATSWCSKADLLSATIEYNEGNYKSAYDEFYRLAHLGNKDAIYNIGVMHLHGQGVSQSLARAHAWFQLAADYGLDEAREAAQLVAQQVDEKVQLALESNALNQKLSFAQFQNTLKPVFSEAQYTNEHEQPPLRIHTIDAKYPQSAYEKGIEGWVWLEFDVDESGAVKDVDIVDSFPDNTFDRAIYNAVRRWRYEPYKVNGKVQAYSSRSLLYHFTTFKGKRYQASFASQKKDYQRRINQLIEGAEQGNALIQYYIANWLNTEEHNATKLLRFHWQQSTASSDLLLESAVNGYPNSQYRLGTNLLRGEFTHTDRKKGLNWILNAAQSGFVFAQYRLARELLDKRYVEYDREKAKRWLINAANEGHFRAMRDLIAICIEDNNEIQAVNYLTLAMEKDARHPDLWLSQSKLLLRNGNIKQAKQALANAKQYALQRNWSTIKIEVFEQSINQ